MSQRVYHDKIETRGDIRVIDDGDVLIETTGPWQTWIGEPGADVHSTKFFPPERFLVPRDMAERLVRGNAAKIVEEKPKPKRKAKKASKGKGAE